MIDFPCKDCTQRYKACHDSCEAYAAVKNEKDKIKKLKAFDNSFRRLHHDKYMRTITVKNPHSFLNVCRNNKKSA